MTARGLPTLIALLAMPKVIARPLQISAQRLSRDLQHQSHKAICLTSVVPAYRPFASSLHALFALGAGTLCTSKEDAHVLLSVQSQEMFMIMLPYCVCLCQRQQEVGMCLDMIFMMHVTSVQIKTSDLIFQEDPQVDLMTHTCRLIPQLMTIPRLKQVDNSQFFHMC